MCYSKSKLNNCNYCIGKQHGIIYLYNLEIRDPKDNWNLIETDMYKIGKTKRLLCDRWGELNRYGDKHLLWGWEKGFRAGIFTDDIHCLEKVIHSSIGGRVVNSNTAMEIFQLDVSRLQKFTDFANDPFYKKRFLMRYFSDYSMGNGFLHDWFLNNYNVSYEPNTSK